MRDTIKEFDYFRDYISREDLLHKKRVKEISQNKVPIDRIEIVKADMSKNKLYQSIAKYSSGYIVSDMLPDLYNAINLTYEGWKKKGTWKIYDNELGFLNQYSFSAYYQMLTMLSLGYLLNIPNEKFQLLVDVVDRDNIKDKLFEFIMLAKLPHRKAIESESYQKFFFIPEAFDRLRQIIGSSDKDYATKQLGIYLGEDWYHIQKDTGIKDSHKSKHNIYYGYWSFETAAIVKIMGLDDSSFIDNQYYPKDLVHRQEETPKKKGLLGKLGF